MQRRRASSMEEARLSSYREAWKNYRSLRLAYWVLWAACLPTVGSVALLSGWLFNTYVPAFVCGGLFGFCVLVLGWLYALWSCPRCGSAFRSWEMFRFKNCAHCGLPLWGHPSDPE